MASPPRQGADPLAPILDAIRPGLAMLGLPAYVIDAEQRYRFVNAAYEVHFERQGRRSRRPHGGPRSTGRRRPTAGASRS